MNSAQVAFIHYASGRRVCRRGRVWFKPRRVRLLRVARRYGMSSFYSFIERAMRDFDEATKRVEA